MNGVLNLLKEPGPTSHDMVQKIRRLLKEKKVGHAGTLDPGASGVLVLGIGKATRVLEYLLEQPKTYTAEVIFGCSTSTADIYGDVVEAGSGTITRAELQSVLEEFHGAQKQIPPMASAIKVGGKKLYELMREGIEIEREPRDVTIYSLEILSAPELISESTRVLIRAQVSKGTYIRSLCQDIGEKIGLKAHMGFLLRSASGGLKVEDALLVDEVAERLDKGIPFLTELDEVLDFPKYDALWEKQKALLNGQSLSSRDLKQGLDTLKPDQRVRVYTDQGLFVGIYRYVAEDSLLKPEKIFIS